MYEVMRDVASSVLKFIKFKIEYSVEERSLPCLDMDIWVENQLLVAPGTRLKRTSKERLSLDARGHHHHTGKCYIDSTKKSIAATVAMLARSAIP